MLPDLILRICSWTLMNTLDISGWSNCWMIGCSVFVFLLSRVRFWTFDNINLEKTWKPTRPVLGNHRNLLTNTSSTPMNNANVQQKHGSRHWLVFQFGNALIQTIWSEFWNLIQQCNLTKIRFVRCCRCGVLPLQFQQSRPDIDSFTAELLKATWVQKFSYPSAGAYLT